MGILTRFALLIGGLILLIIIVIVVLAFIDCLGHFRRKSQAPIPIKE